jgi:hypothetical protein
VPCASVQRTILFKNGDLERWYLVLGGVAVGRGFEPQSVPGTFLRRNINIILVLSDTAWGHFSS